MYKISIIFLFMALFVNSISHSNNIFEECSRLITEFKKDNDSIHSGLEDTYTSLPSSVEVPDQFYVLEIFDQLVPLPVTKYSKISLVVKDGVIKTIGVSDNGHSHSVIFLFQGLGNKDFSPEFTYSELLDQAYRVTPNTLDCESESLSFVRDTLALLVKNLEYPMKKPRSIYRTDWGWLRSSGIYEGNKTIWHGKYQIKGDEFLEITWKLPLSQKNFGFIAADQSIIKASASLYLKDLAKCIQQRKAECFHDIKEMAVNEVNW